MKEQKLRFFIEEEENDNDDNEEITLCSFCNGSGEGSYDGSTCQMCKGKGEVKFK